MCCSRSQQRVQHLKEVGLKGELLCPGWVGDTHRLYVWPVVYSVVKARLSPIFVLSLAGYSVACGAFSAGNVSHPQREGGRVQLIYFIGVIVLDVLFGVIVFVG